jgi:hypothetical protein
MQPQMRQALLLLLLLLLGVVGLLWQLLLPMPMLQRLKVSLR